MNDLISWLRQQLDAEERTARAATAGPWRWRDPGGRKVKLALLGDAGQMVLPVHGEPYPLAPDAEHIASNDPDRVLRQVQAHRAILDLHGGQPHPNPTDEPVDMACTGFGVTPVYPEQCRTLRALASIYSDRDGYNPEWSA